MQAKPRVLVISFSEVLKDARVLRQLALITKEAAVTTVCYGSAPPGVYDHLEIPASLPSLPQTPGGIARLAFRRFRSVQYDAPAVARARRLLEGREFDLVVANEARALPLAHAVAGEAPVWGDMHEWAPEERTHVLSWRILVSPYMWWVCSTYLPRTAAVTTVNESIAQLYNTHFGTSAQVVRNARTLERLEPSPMEPDRIRMVHSGAAVPGRELESLILSTQALDDRFTLDLYLIQARDGGKYWRTLRKLAAECSRIAFHEAVAPDELPRELNHYDVGIYLLPPRTTNHHLMLPNKFFDFVQARLAIVFGSATETDALIRKYDLGAVSKGYTPNDLAETLASLSPESVSRFKANTHAAAKSLSSEEDERVQRSIVTKLLRR